MKKIVLLPLVCLAFGFVASAQTSADTTVVFKKLIHDFGNIEQNAGPQTYKFEFTNTGRETIIIQQVQASCGCTTPGWTREPVAPGEKGEVVATYIPGAPMPFDKTLTVITNGTPNRIVLRVRGVVTAPPPDNTQYF